MEHEQLVSGYDQLGQSKQFLLALLAQLESYRAILVYDVSR